MCHLKEGSGFTVEHANANYLLCKIIIIISTNKTNLEPSVPGTLGFRPQTWWKQWKLHLFIVFFYVCQGPCTGNQQSLAHSRLWDAVVGFLHVFAHMMMKLAQVKNVPKSSHTSIYMRSSWVYYGYIFCRETRKCCIFNDPIYICCAIVFLCFSWWIKSQWNFI